MHKKFLKISLVLLTFFSLLSPIQAHGSMDYFYEDPTDITRKYATATEFVGTLSQDASALIAEVYGGLRPKQRDSLFRDPAFHYFINDMPLEHRNNFIFLMNRDEEDETKLKIALTIDNLLAYSTFQQVFNANQELVTQASASAGEFRVKLETRQRGAFFQTIFDGTEDLARHAIRVWIKGTWSYDQQLPTMTSQWPQNFLATLLGNHDAQLLQRASLPAKLEYAVTTLRQRFIEMEQPLDNLALATPSTALMRKILSRSSLLYLEMLTALKDLYMDTDLAPEAKAQKFNGIFTECASLAIGVQNILSTITTQIAQQQTQ